MVLDILLFTYMAYRYKYLTPEAADSKELGDLNGKPLNGIDNAAYKSTE